MNIVRFEEIKDLVNKYRNLWVVGERRWTICLANIVLEKEKGKAKKGNTGIFLHKEINYDSFESYSDCIRLVFFNNDVQFLFIATDSSCKDYVYHLSEISRDKAEKFEFEILHSKKEGKSKVLDSKSANRNYRFSFAQDIGAIPENLDSNDILVLRDKDEWRLYHEQQK